MSARPTTRSWEESEEGFAAGAPGRVWGLPFALLEASLAPLALLGFQTLAKTGFIVWGSILTRFG